MKIYISVLNGPTDETFIRRLPLLIGRALVESREVLDLNDYDPEKLISQQHCEITINNDGLKIIDLGSKNGTYIFKDGKLKQIPKDEPYPLSLKDIFVVGPLLLRVEALE
jgi:pSer/pThr/pTyr-binding forkhead associated (FHA) protein